MDTKCCTKCGTEKPRTLEHFPPDKRRSDGLQSNCRECHRKCDRECHAAHPERTRAWRTANPEKIHEYGRKYRASNLEKHRERSRKWSRAHAEYHREKTRVWRVANLEKCRVRDRAYAIRYRMENPERFRDQRRASDSRYHAAHPEVGNAKASKRRARKRNALDPSASQTAITAIHAEAKMAEAFMGSPFAVDHIVPLARGGKHHEDNLRSLPARLNGIKGSKLDSEVTDAEFLAWISPEPTYELITIIKGKSPCPGDVTLSSVLAAQESAALLRVAESPTTFHAAAIAGGIKCVPIAKEAQP